MTVIVPFIYTTLRLVIATLLGTTSRRVWTTLLAKSLHYNGVHNVEGFVAAKWNIDQINYCTCRNSQRHSLEESFWRKFVKKIIEENWWRKLAEKIRKAAVLSFVWVQAVFNEHLNTMNLEGKRVCSIKDKDSHLSKDVQRWTNLPTIGSVVPYPPDPNIAKAFEQ